MTPHPGEFARLAGLERDSILDDPVSAAVAEAARREAVVALKGACTLVAVPAGGYWIFDGMNAAMGTGGSGDVLAGIIAAGVAGGMPVLDAVLFGVSLHGAVGRLARRRRGWFLSEDMLPFISRLLDGEP
jgi:NAD(P)H-hydrate repair Nnr-like enzyme with NAD(P)H-hydrate dehydratase domain